MIQFDWDPTKAELNLRKHSVALKEAATVLREPFGITIFDPDHSEEEDRFINCRFVGSRSVTDGWPYRPRRENPHHQCTGTHPCGARGI